MEFGIRFKLILAFLICFGAVAAFSRMLLVSNITPHLLDIEKDGNTRDVERVVEAIDSELENLALINKDWGNWDDMYHYIKNRNAQFVSANIDVSSITNASLSLILILDRQGHAVYSLSIPHTSKQSVDELFGSNTTEMLSLFSKRPLIQNCGFMEILSKLRMVCWKPILHSDRTGPEAGTLVMARDFDNTMLMKVQEQTRINFMMLPATSLLDGGERWNIHRQKLLTENTVRVNKSERNITFDYELKNLFGDPSAYIHLDLPRVTMRQMNIVLANTTLVIGLIAIIMGVTLFITLQFLLINPLIGLQHSMARIRRKKNWGSRLPVQHHDEIGHLGLEINTLLEVIDQQVQNLETLSLTDAMTGLANRRAFDLRLQNEMFRFKRTGNQLSVIILDIDFFKQYNDHYGHAAGDRAIQAVAEAIKAAAKRNLDLRSRRQNDHARGARIGGEEFAILLPETGQEGAQHVAERIRAELAKLAILHAKSGVSEILTVSIGIATATNSDNSAEQLLDHADQALYFAKASGRNCIESWPLTETRKTTNKQDALADVHE